VAWVGIFHSFGLYATKNLSSADELRRVIGASAVGAAVLMVFGAGAFATTESLAMALLLLVGLEVVSRLAWRRYSRSLREKDCSRTARS
jgi:membrane protein implicated in regulation of membrane protease activity